MTVTVSSPATIFDLADIAESAKPMSRDHWAVLKQAAQMGETFVFRAGDQLIGVAGLIALEPLADRGAEAWFFFDRQHAPAQMVGLLRAIRLTLARSSYRAIVTLCTSRAGARVARAAGFEKGAERPEGEIWYAGPFQEQRGQEGARITAAP